jgi:hypothetical protein
MPAIALDTKQRYWVRYLALLTITALIALAVSSLGERLHLRERHSITVGVVFFLFFSLNPDRPGRQPRSLVQRLVSGVTAAAVTIFIYAVLGNP